ncbi:Gfo/Idh/MocA family protein [Paraburkholderia sabiae]|uniref:Gfo/Idh/MocA family oxidoreductase n=1 Tax=Paraburkholderia sabiae TaxID=273251 RepID=A0ABU9QHZ0_9BURK|nr:Gfo/Idh/MocA family oxidoreductase [Paraburkholderia sabiae]WJZ77420.1 Gfo/Idh/MocA family oxidoreductase [Paraburkholderia sabiae]CAD6557752.1 dTDP-3,4-didehydro-2,6-dideoxy-alpha-D-glucose 3-reductase [Paraburkholderia sabiae]
MLKFGILGAARIVPWALLEPATRRNDVNIAAVAARRPGVAAAFAQAHGIARSYDSYEALLDDSSIDVIYNPLPPHLHAEFSIKALEAGKHVLCEKPFAMNAQEARAMQSAAHRANRRIVEAFHDRYHPVFGHLLNLVESGRLGSLKSLRAVFNHTIPEAPEEFRRNPEMGGGALIELGCYPVHWCRSLLRTEPEVISAEALVTSNGCDEEMRARLRFPAGVEASVEACMTPGWQYHARFTIEGERGTVVAENSLLPHLGHSIIERVDGVTRQYTVAGSTTFDYQIEAFVGAIVDGNSLPTEGQDSLGNMMTIDAIYAKAGVSRVGGHR